jgi:predicted 3-demethylubiquinone-9 3-methyltransferase (glyoxalase superfamily)
MQKITPFLWFNNQAEEAAKFYISVFSNRKNPTGSSKILGISYYEEEATQRTGLPAGAVITVRFTLDGQEFTALNGGTMFKFTEAVSFVIDCKDQEEVDYFWEKLSEGGSTSMCGWLKDKYGLSWQVVPSIAIEWMQDKNAAKRKSVTNALLNMEKLDISVLKKAYEQN